MSADSVTFDENLLYAPADDPDIFPAEVSPNPTAEHLRLSGQYELHVNTANLALVDPTTRKPVFTWPFRYIRRYGAGKDSRFQFEAGRRCPSGEGLFILDVQPHRGEAVFACIQMRLQVMRERDLQYQSDGSPAVPGKPAVPERQLSHANYQNVPAAAAAVTSSGNGKESEKNQSTARKAAGKKASGKKNGASSTTVKPTAAAVQSKQPQPPPVPAAAAVVQSKLLRPQPSVNTRPSAPAATADEAMYAEVDLDRPPARTGAAGVGAGVGASVGYRNADEQPPLYSAVVRPTPRGPGVATPPTAAAGRVPAQPSDVNRLIAERRASLQRLDVEDAEGYGTVSSVRAAASGGGLAAASTAPPPAEYGFVQPHPTASQQYSLVTPSLNYDPADEAYTSTGSLHRPATGARS